MQIFLVEDSPLVLRRLTDLLASVPGASVAGHASEEDAAIRDIIAAKPDLVLLDLTLESGSGFNVLRALRDRAPGIDVCILSNSALEPCRRIAAALGARGFFDKSSEFERVREVVAKRAV